MVTQLILIQSFKVRILAGLPLWSDSGGSNVNEAPSPIRRHGIAESNLLDASAEISDGAGLISSGCPCAQITGELNVIDDI